MVKILYNAHIYTQDPNNPKATATVIDGNRFLAIGNDLEILTQYQQPGKTELFNLEGRTVIPGLIDAHIHLQSYALGLQKINCEVPSRTECLQRVRERANIATPGEWILGHGWNQNEWLEGYGTCADLDTITSHNPVYLTAKSLHAGWANSAALHLAGITRNTRDPLHGRIGRGLDGSPNGILYESAMELIETVIPEPSINEITEAIDSAQTQLLKLGLTGVHDFDGSKCFSALQILDNKQKLNLRVVKGIPLENLSHAIALGLRSGYGSDFLTIGPVKAFADGALGPHTAAMMVPYDNEPDNKGILMMDGEEINEYGRQAVQNGLVLAIHAIGDRANHEVLNGYTRLREFEKGLDNLTGSPAPRHRIEHVQILHPRDLTRLSELGVIASMQPIHATSDMYMADRYWGKRSEYAYAWRTQLQYKGHLAFGSDAPVESPNPFWGLHAAITRQRQDGSPGITGWYPEQRISIDESINAYTWGAAYAANLENRLGMIAPGYFADLIVLDTDPMTCEPEILYRILPLRTMVAGKWVFDQYS